MLTVNVLFSAQQSDHEEKIIEEHDFGVAVPLDVGSRAVGLAEEILHVEMVDKGGEIAGEGLLFGSEGAERGHPEIEDEVLAELGGDVGEETADLLAAERGRLVGQVAESGNLYAVGGAHQALVKETELLVFPRAGGNLVGADQAPFRHVGESRGRLGVGAVAVADIARHFRFADRPGVESLHPREDRRQQLQLVVAHEDEESPRRGLLDHFQELVGRLGAELLRKPYQENLLLRHQGREGVGAYDIVGLLHVDRRLGVSGLDQLEPFLLGHGGIFPQHVEKLRHEVGRDVGLRGNHRKDEMQVGMGELLMQAA